MEFQQNAFSLAVSAENPAGQSDALFLLAAIKCQLGQYFACQKYAYESQRIAKVSADLRREARGLQVEAISWCELGNYKHVVSLCKRIEYLLTLSGMPDGELGHVSLALRAQVHILKSEYVQAYDIYTRILHQLPIDKLPHGHAFILSQIARIDVATGTPMQDVQKKIDTAKAIFNKIRDNSALVTCDTTITDLYIREGNIVAAEKLLLNHLKLQWGNYNEHVTICLEKLGNGSYWSTIQWSSTWTTVFLVHVLKLKQQAQIYKALQFLGHVFLTSDDLDTAISLFTVALDGFTKMDIHCSRAECMLQLGEISLKQGDPLKTIEFLNSARPLFEISSQGRSVASVDLKLQIAQKASRKHEINLDLISGLSLPTGVTEGVSFSK
jgi:tetratricopeptide (TPR) repeat protein